MKISLIISLVLTLVFFVSIPFVFTVNGRTTFDLDELKRDWSWRYYLHTHPEHADVEEAVWNLNRLAERTRVNFKPTEWGNLVLLEGVAGGIMTSYPITDFEREFEIECELAVDESDPGRIVFYQVCDTTARTLPFPWEQVEVAQLKQVDYIIVEQGTNFFHPRAKIMSRDSSFAIFVNLYVKNGKDEKWYFGIDYYDEAEGGDYEYEFRSRDQDLRRIRNENRKN